MQTVLNEQEQPIDIEQCTWKSRHNFKDNTYIHPHSTCSEPERRLYLNCLIPASAFNLHYYIWCLTIVTIDGATVCLQSAKLKLSHRKLSGRHLTLNFKLLANAASRDLDITLHREAGLKNFICFKVHGIEFVCCVTKKLFLESPALPREIPSRPLL